MNIIMAVNMGGDDFVPKPFDLSVLTAQSTVGKGSSFTIDLSSYPLEVE